MLWGGRHAADDLFRLYAASADVLGSAPESFCHDPGDRCGVRRFHQSSDEGGAAEGAGDMDRPTKVNNGRYVADGPGAAVRHQNDETKRIRGPEAG